MSCELNSGYWFWPVHTGAQRIFQAGKQAGRQAVLTPFAEARPQPDRHAILIIEKRERVGDTAQHMLQGISNVSASNLMQLSQKGG